MSEPSIVRSVDTSGRRLIALTFDDGPGEWTPAILDLLAASGVRATFFVLGRAVAERARVLRRTVAERHEVGNHTYSHRRASELTDGEIREELLRTTVTLHAVASVRPTLVRPPYGDDAERFARAAAMVGLGPAVLWSIDPLDWRESPPETIVEHVLREAHPGAIVDLHDGWGATPGNRQATVEALETLLPELRASGYDLVTVSALMAAARTDRP